jgi:hypothetical protein
MSTKAVTTATTTPARDPAAALAARRNAWLSDETTAPPRRKAGTPMVLFLYAGADRSTSSLVRRSTERAASPGGTHPRRREYRSRRDSTTWCWCRRTT